MKKSTKIKIRMIKVRCDNCQQFYKIELCKTALSQARLLDWSVCSNCDKPRNPTLYRRIDDVRRCRSCGIPYLGIMRRGKCHNCYMDWYRNEKNVTKIVNRVIYT